MSPGGVWEVISKLFVALWDASGDILAPNAFENHLFSIFDDFRTPCWEAFVSPGGVWEVIWKLFGALWEVFGGGFWVLCRKL